MAIGFSEFSRVLKSLDVAGQVKELPESAPTAAAAAGQLGCEAGAIANSLIFNADGDPLLVMTSGRGSRSAGSAPSVTPRRSRP